MRSTSRAGKILIATVVATSCYLLLPGRAWAHCDTTTGPVTLEAKAALEKGEITPILKWVKKENEPEIKAAFVKAVAVRAKGPEIKELADQYFLETLVRLHRAGEGAPYTGIKSEPVEPIIAMADKALADGSADEMVKKISGHMAEGIREKFKQALDAKNSKDKNVEAGREFVEAYVSYMHYIEDIHTAILSDDQHHAGNGKSALPATAERKEHKD